jgi:hypothetical protein
VRVCVEACAHGEATVTQSVCACGRVVGRPRSHVHTFTRSHARLHGTRTRGRVESIETEAEDNGGSALVRMCVSDRMRVRGGASISSDVCQRESDHPMGARVAARECVAASRVAGAHTVGGAVMHQHGGVAEAVDAVVLEAATTVDGNHEDELLGTRWP